MCALGSKVKIFPYYMIVMHMLGFAQVVQKDYTTWNKTVLSVVGKSMRGASGLFHIHRDLLIL